MPAASEPLAARLRQVTAVHSQMVEKKMFGGVGFMLAGNMAVGVTARGELMVRVAPDAAEEALARGARQMLMGERPMKGFMTVPPDGIVSDAALAAWVGYAERYVRTLPPK